MMDISPIVNDQNLAWADSKHRETLEFPRRRAIIKQVEEYASDMQAGRALALLGPRQVGKTTLLRQLADDLLDREWPAANITFFDFSDDRLLEPVSPRDVVSVRPVGLTDSLPRIFLFDEIHEAPRWQKWLKQAVDEGRRKGGQTPRFIVTGSSASSLRDGGVESGQGRWDELTIESLTFREFVELGGSPGTELREMVARSPNLFDRYLQIGGFPAHVRAEFPREARRRIREDIADRAILRDLRGAGLEVDRVRRLFVYLINNSGIIWNQAKGAADLQANRKSIADWIQVLEGTRLITRLDRDLRARARAQLRPQPKMFASDHGLIVAFSQHAEPLDDSDTRGRIFEAVVFRHLRELARQQDGSLGFARLDDDLEIDFVLRFRRHAVAIEVTSSPELRSRKLDRLTEASREMGIEKKLLVYGGLVSETVGDVRVVPLHEFVLDPDRYAGVES